MIAIRTDCRVRSWSTAGQTVCRWRRQTASIASLMPMQWPEVHCASRDEIQRFSPHPFNLLTFWQIWQAGEAPLREWTTAAPAPLLTEHLSSLWAAAHRLMDTVLPLLGETPPSPIHGDLRAENALFQRGGAILVDWEFFGLGDPAQEIGRFLFFGGDDWTDESHDDWREMYYCSNTDPSLPDRVDIYLRLFSSQAVTYLLEGIRQKAVPPVSAFGSRCREFPVPVLSHQRLNGCPAPLADTMGPVPYRQWRKRLSGRRNRLLDERSVAGKVNLREPPPNGL